MEKELREETLALRNVSCIAKSAQKSVETTPLKKEREKNKKKKKIVTVNEKGHTNTRI